MLPMRFVLHYEISLPWEHYVGGDVWWIGFRFMLDEEQLFFHSLLIQHKTNPSTSQNQVSNKPSTTNPRTLEALKAVWRVLVSTVGSLLETKWKEEEDK
jgi:hypothetical protein